MSDVLCIYYSRSGNTRKAAEEIGEALGAEIVEISDGQAYSGWGGYMQAGMSAMRRSTRKLLPFQTEKNIEDYRLVVVATPVWAGRCAAPIRSLLKRRGLEMHRVAYVLTRSGSRRCEAVYDQMDLYTGAKHLFAVSLQPESVGYVTWRDHFIHDAQKYLEQNDAG